MIDQCTHYPDGFDQAYPHILQDLVSRGTRVTPRPGTSLGETLEIVNYQFSIPGTMPLFRGASRRFSLPFMFIEPVYLFTTQDNQDIAGTLIAYAPNLKKLAFNEARKEFDGNYGDRIHLRGLDSTGLLTRTIAGSQLVRAYNILRADPNSRRAVVTIHNPLWDIVDGKSIDIPCTLNLQFLIRDKRLHCLATMRSNDVWYGTQYNVFQFTFLQRAMASWLGIEAGTYFHRVNSMHLYLAHCEKALILCERCFSKVEDKLPLPPVFNYPHHRSPEDTYLRMRDIMAFEKRLRLEADTSFEAAHEYEAFLKDLLLDFFGLLKSQESVVFCDSFRHNRSVPPNTMTTTVKTPIPERRKTRSIEQSDDGSEPTSAYVNQD